MANGKENQQATLAGFETLVAPPSEGLPALQSRFIIPPFSVFDTRQGYWQNRKRTWLSLGMKSEVGRGDSLLFANDEIAFIDHYSQKRKADAAANNTANSGPERERNIKYATALPGGFDEDKYGKKQKMGTSIFDPVLAELCYKWFCPTKGVIVDPFAGGSVRGIVASVLGYTYHGIDLNKEQIEANRAQLNLITDPSLTKPAWYYGDSVKIRSILPAGLKADFIFSCPPYHNLEVYTDDPDDLSNQGYDTFLVNYGKIIAECILTLKENRFACFVVSELRNEIGAFKRFVPDTILAFYRGGAFYYNEIILVNVVGSLPVRVTGQFQGYRKVGRCHQNVLVFYKGDPEKIKDYFGKVDISNEIPDQAGEMPTEPAEAAPNLPEAPLAPTTGPAGPARLF